MAGRRGLPPQLRVQLLGQFQVWRDNILIRPQGWKTRKHQAIFKLLVSSRGQFFSQEELIERLWPETDPGRAAASLRKRISELRKILQPQLIKASDSQFLLTHPDGYSFSSEADCVVDVEEFDRHCQQAHCSYQHGEWLEAARAYEAAARWYQGEYLAEDRYEDWVIAERERWSGIFRELLLRLAECYARLGWYERAVARCTQAMKAHDNTELGYRQLMLYHYLAGHQAEALRVYEHYRDLLSQRFGSHISPDIQELYDQILQGRILKVEQIYPPRGSALPLPDRGPRAPLVGREAESGRLQHHFRAAAAGHGRLVLISGESGIGKSRLAQELLDFARQSGSLVLQGHGALDQLADAYRPITEGLRPVASQLTPGDFQAIGHIWLAEAARLIPELRNCIPGLLERPPPVPDERQPARRHEALTQLMLGLANSRNYVQPLVLFLDDLHLAAPSLLDWLAYLLPRLAHQPLLLLAAYRSEEIQEAGVFAQWRQVASNDHGAVFRELRLTPLSTPATERLSAEWVPDLSLSRRQQLVRQSAGNPLYLLTLLQHEAEVRSVSAPEDHPEAPMVPARLAELMRQRLQGFTPDERRLLRLAAVIGARFEWSLLQRVWGYNIKRLDQLLEQFLLRGLLIHEADACYAFGHDQVWQAVYNTLGDERRIIHRQVAEALEKLKVHDLDRFLETLARHFFAAHRWEKALLYASKAIARAHQAYANEEGIQLVSLGLQAADQLNSTAAEATLGEAAYGLLLWRVALYERLGRRAEELKDLCRLIQIAHDLHDDKKYSEVLSAQAVYYQGIGAYRRAVRAAYKALQIIRRAGDRAAEATILNELGKTHWSLAEYDEALGCYRRSRRIFRRIGDQFGEASVLHRLGALYAHWGRYSEALRQYEDAYRIREGIDDQAGLAATLNNMGNVHRARGDYGKALAHYAQSEEICHAIGDQAGLAQVLNNIGDLYWLMGACQKAFDYLRRAHEIRSQIGDKRGIGNSLYELGATYWRSGECQEAMHYLTQAAEILGAVGDRRGRGFALAFLAAVYVDLGQYSKALGLCREAHALGDEIQAKDLQTHSLTIETLAHLGLGRPRQALQCSRRVVALLEQELCHWDPQECYFTHFKTLQACGRADASSYLAKAYREVVKRAQSLSDLALRETFLTQVPTNRQIVHAYEELTDPSRR